MYAIYDIWDRALGYLKEELSIIVYVEYIETLTPLYVSEDTFVLRTDENYRKNVVDNHYLTLIRKAINFATIGKNYDIQILVGDENSLPTNSITHTSNDFMYQDEIETPSRFDFNPKYTFDTFVEGGNNSLAYSVAHAVAENPGTKYNPFFIYGGVGLGKTHLMQAIAQYIIKEDPRAKVVYITSEKFMNDLIYAIKKKTNVQFRNKYRGVDILLIDDIQFLAGKDGTQEEIFHTFNDLQNAGKQIVFTSDKEPRAIKGFEERLQSRLNSGLTCDISPPTFETKVAILKLKAEADNIDISDSILEYIAENSKSSIRELEAVLIKVKALLELEQIPINSPLLLEHLKKMLSNSSERITPDKILDEVCLYYGLSRDDVFSSKKTANIAHARQVAMFLTRELTDLSLPNIGTFFGGRNHSTVIHAYNKMLSRKELDLDFFNEIKSITALIKQ